MVMSPVPGQKQNTNIERNNKTDEKKFFCQVLDAAKKVIRATMLRWRRKTRPRPYSACLCYNVTAPLLRRILTPRH